MFIELDFNSNEAIYMQLRNQIILGIAQDKIKNGERCRLFGNWRKISV